MKMRIKKGDSVKILSGKDRGKVGTVLKVLPKTGGVVVENVNVHTKFVRSRNPNQKGTQVSNPSPLPAGKVMLIDPATNKPSRSKVEIDAAGNRQRVFIRK